MRPGERIDVIAVAPESGIHAIRTIPFQNEAWKTPQPSQKLATSLERRWPRLCPIIRACIKSRAISSQSAQSR